MITRDRPVLSRVALAVRRTGPGGREDRGMDSFAHEAGSRPGGGNDNQRPAQPPANPVQPTTNPSHPAPRPGRCDGVPFAAPGAGPLGYPGKPRGLGDVTGTPRRADRRPEQPVPWDMASRIEWLGGL